MEKINNFIMIGVTEFKQNPIAHVAASEGRPVLVLNHNKPAFYCLTPTTYKEILEKIEELNVLKETK